MEQKKERKKRRSVTSDTIRLVRKGIQKELLLKQIADNADISIQCAGKLIRRLSRGETEKEIIGTKKGRKSLATIDLKEKIKSILLADAEHTTKSLKEELERENICMSISSINRIIKNIKFKRKRILPEPKKKNVNVNDNEKITKELITTRQLFANRMTQLTNENLVFLGQIYFNLLPPLIYGYAPMGVKCYRKSVVPQRATDITLMLAIKETGIVSYMIKQGQFIADEIITFLNEKIFQKYNDNVLVIAPCLKKRFHEESLLEYLSKIYVLHIPEHSPEMNPINGYFSQIKEKLQPFPKIKKSFIENLEKLLQENSIDFNVWLNQMRTTINLLDVANNNNSISNS